MNKKIYFGLILLFLALNIFTPALIHTAETPDPNTSVGILDQVAEDARYNRNDSIIDQPEKFIGKIIVMIISFVGIIFLVLTVYAGYLWMTAGGNKEQVTKAQELLVNGIIGVIIVLAAYIISYYIIGRLSQFTIN